MSDREQHLDEYIAAKPLLRHVRVMQRFYRVISSDPELVRLTAKIHCALMDVLEEELAPHALTFALALAELEDAYPQIIADTTATECK